MFQIEIRPFLGSDEEDARRNVNKFLADNPARENICDVQILSSQPHAHGNWQMRIGLVYKVPHRYTDERGRG